MVAPLQDTYTLREAQGGKKGIGQEKGRTIRRKVGGREDRIKENEREEVLVMGATE